MKTENKPQHFGRKTKLSKHSKPTIRERCQKLTAQVLSRETLSKADSPSAESIFMSFLKGLLKSEDIMTTSKPFYSSSPSGSRIFSWIRFAMIALKTVVRSFVLILARNNGSERKILCRDYGWRFNQHSYRYTHTQTYILLQPGSRGVP